MNGCQYLGAEVLEARTFYLIGSRIRIKYDDPSALHIWFLKHKHLCLDAAWYMQAITATVPFDKVRKRSVSPSSVRGWPTVLQILAQGASLNH